MTLEVPMKFPTLTETILSGEYSAFDDSAAGRLYDGVLDLVGHADDMYAYYLALCEDIALSLSLDDMYAYYLALCEDIALSLSLDGMSVEELP
jgi:hypothetical protein